MSLTRDIHVYLLPDLAPPHILSDGVAVAIDVLRTTTSIVHALAAGSTAIIPCEELEEARALAGEMPVGRGLLVGEREGLPPPGFDLGNSPRKFTTQLCKGATIILSTTNGARALIRSAKAARCLVAAFVNYSAICEQLLHEMRPVYIVCAGTDGDVTLEDTLLAGAVVDCLCEHRSIRLNDGARLAWDCFEAQGGYLESALKLSRGGQKLCHLDFEEDISTAARVDAFNLVPELRRDPLRIEVGSVGIATSHWKN